MRSTMKFELPSWLSSAVMGAVVSWNSPTVSVPEPVNSSGPNALADPPLVVSVAVSVAVSVSVSVSVSVCVFVSVLVRV